MLMYGAEFRNISTKGVTSNICSRAGGREGGRKRRREG